MTGVLWMVGYSLRKIWRPDMFQGGGRKRKYFEGWYFKIIDRSEKNVFSIIPGISYCEDKSKSHAFIQIINGKTHASDYFTYDKDSFKYSKRDFEIFIGRNAFSKHRINFDVSKGEVNIAGELTFERLTPWPSFFSSPGTMGWYTFVPFMECYHECISLNHRIAGTIRYNNEIIDFTDGLGYMEKDWGKSFPSSWIWLQCNHFNAKNISIMVSIANIPWLGGHFVGFIAGLWLEGRIYRFTTYTGAKLENVSLGEDNVFICISDNSYELNIRIKRGESGRLYSPVNGEMVGEISESISALAYITLYRLTKNNKEKILETAGRNAGLEVMGNLNEIIK